MTESLTLPSNARIEKAVMYSYDGSRSESLLAILTEINLSQSLDAAAYMGSIKVGDNIGLLENFPIRGEERLELTIVSNDIETKKELEVQIYKVDNIQLNESNDGVSYYLHFISRISFNASKKRIITSYSSIVSNVCRDLFNQYFAKTDFSAVGGLPFLGQQYPIKKTKRNFIVQPTYGIFKGVIPNYSPTEAMYHLSTRSFIKDRGFTSCSFRFFETLDDFYFVSDEYLIKSAVDQNDVIDLYYSVQVSKDPKDLDQQINTIENIEYPSRVDTAMDMYSGGYTNRVIEVDLMRRQVRNLDFNYLDDSNFLDMNGEPREADSYIHSEQFTQETFNTENARRFILFRDYSTDGDIAGVRPPDQHIAEIVSKRVSYQHHLNNTAISASLKGRLDIRPGSVINLEVAELSAASERTKNPQLSGNYLVHTVNTSIVHEELNTNLRLIKYDWST